MRLKIHKILSALLSLVVLFSTFSFTVESHYCGDELVDVAVFSEVDGCGDDVGHNDINSEDKKDADSCCDAETKGHCKDIKTEIEGEPLDYFGIQKTSLEKVFFVAVCFNVFQQDILELNEAVLGYTDTSQIFFQKDRIILFENFRI